MYLNAIHSLCQKVKGKDYEDRACCQSGGIVPSDSCPRFKVETSDSNNTYEETCSSPSSHKLSLIVATIGMAAISALTIIHV